MAHQYYSSNIGKKVTLWKPWHKAANSFSTGPSSFRERFGFGWPILYPTMHFLQQSRTLAIRSVSGSFRISNDG
jgi:hypothetical protein